MLFEVINSTTFLAALTSFLIGLYLFLNKSYRKTPPGPIGLPVVGYLPFLTRKPYLKLQELSKQYGPIYSIKIASRETVFLCDYESVKDAYSRDVFIGVPQNDIFPLHQETLELKAVTHLPWKQQRRFSLHLLRDLGLGKSSLATHVAEEISELLEKIEASEGAAIDVSQLLTTSTSNNVSSLVFGKRRKFDDPKRMMLNDIFRKMESTAPTVALLALFPWIKKIVELIPFGKHQQLKQINDDFKNYVREEIKEHKDSSEENNMNDFISGYLAEIEKRKDDPTSTFKESVLEDLAGMFFGAGSGTVRIAVDWLLVASVAFPDIQKKVQAEIDEVIGRDQFPSQSDSQRMVYTMATIMEVLRWRATLPISFPRVALADTELNSYFIREGTQVISLLWAIHHNPETWGDDVADFKPERFLSDDQKEIRKPDYFIPFSVGKRACPGEPLAWMEVFMYYAAILQKFTLHLPENTKPDLEGVLSIGIAPKPYKIRFLPRS